MKTPKRLRIFVDCHVFDKGFQGTRTYIQGLYLELIKDNSRHFFLAASDTGNLQDIFGKAENITYLKYKSSKALSRLGIEIPRMIRKNQIDFAHFQYRVPPVKLCRYIVTIHDVLFEDFPEDFPKLNRLQSFLTYKASARMSDIVLTVSDYSKKQIERHLKVKRVWVTPNAVEDVFFEPYDKAGVTAAVSGKFGISSRYIIYVSRWEPRKNHHLLLEQFVNLGLFRDFNLVFIGDTTFHNKKYDQLFDSLDDDVKRKIFSFQKVSFPDMLLLLRGAAIAVYPSRAEGFGIPPLESVAARIPTITSNLTAMADFDFLEDVSFDPANPKDFEEKLVYVTSGHADYGFEGKIAALKQKYNWPLAAAVYNQAITDFLQ
ncbi:glycosyltransferase family 4 protein [Flavobacterium pallidum]|uniref:Glycosyltransferase family 1 protein n=1 Tax=Flavobacterium pallidum TaxID=2172098 RepID=A0A2S1SF92_9FLAO|nr:glycosyltransferase family 1 protein [Flavobacterium pallidum]AWI25070.1 glycosyltransferase family 1 protein [Flavobacterium pallidum]